MTDLGVNPPQLSSRFPSAPHGATPQVAVIVVCYNQAAFVRQCLDSVLEQTVLGQLIIVDDASTDGSQQVIKDWVVERSVVARVILHETNQGICRTGNDGARAVSAEYMAFVAADDYWLPGKLARQLQILENLPAIYGMVYGDALLCDEAGILSKNRFIGNQTRRIPEQRPSGWVFRDLLRGNFIPAPSVLMRTACFTDLGGFDESLLFEDLDFWLRLAQRYKVWYESTPLTVYRIRRGSAVRTRAYRIPMLLDTIRIYRRYLDLEGPDRRLVLDALSRGFYRLYASGAPVGPKYLWLSLRLRVHWQPAVLLPFAMLGLNAQRYERLRMWIRRVVPVLRRSAK
jgi:glycosyltransferase involved in cell wall biosynthesis